MHSSSSSQVHSTKPGVQKEEDCYLTQHRHQIHLPSGHSEKLVFSHLCTICLITVQSVWKDAFFLIITRTIRFLVDLSRFTPKATSSKIVSLIP